MTMTKGTKAPSNVTDDPFPDLSSSNSTYSQRQHQLIRNYNEDQDHEDEKKSENSEHDCNASNQLDGDYKCTSQFQQFTEPLIRRPQHMSLPTTETANVRNTGGNGMKYYRVVYRGVVALLSKPDYEAPRSGRYLSYGEVVASRLEISAEPGTNASGSLSQNHNKFIRVDEILTGGYAFDPPDNMPETTSVAYRDSETPKRSNAQAYSVAAMNRNTVLASANGLGGHPLTLTVSHSSPSMNDNKDLEDFLPEGMRPHGFLPHRTHKNVTILEQLRVPPRCQHGRFFYKIISTTPLPIIAGPSLDAPQTKAMVLPGTIHEISFRMNISDDDENGVCFLKLARRRGYIADRGIAPSLSPHRPGNRSIVSEPLLRDVTAEHQAEDKLIYDRNEAPTDGFLHPVLCGLSSSFEARKRNRCHRPPRRMRDDTAGEREFVPPGTSRNRQNPIDTSVITLSAQSHPLDRLMTPSSNVSVLSDDSSAMDHRHHQTHSSFSSHDIHKSRISGTLSPDRSIARSVKSSRSSQAKKQSSFFLIRVTAPLGLRILDAPHFQVNNLIHGTQQSLGGVATQNAFGSSGSTNVTGLNGLNSAKNHHQLFQTMAGRIVTTAGIAPADNAVIVDPVTKTRILPCGALFEASKRMETSGSLFHHGAGLIKLADNSGWVIVPYKNDLQKQFRKNDEMGPKDEGEFQGFEEIGNAVYNENATEMSLREGKEATCWSWMHVVSRAGIHVVCAPPLVPLQNESKNVELSLSSSASTSNNATQSDEIDIGKNDSDVASSVGSSFFDAMFRGPNRKYLSDIKTDKSLLGQQGDNACMNNNTIPCGMCLQVEHYLPKDKNGKKEHNVQQEYARLRGGQGWIPLFSAGKPACVSCSRRAPPVFRFGSIWFQVKSQQGIKVRLGPSKRAPSIKSNDGVYFRFECGEFLRASEVMTVNYEDSDGRIRSESFAKLYRNRHVCLTDDTKNEDNRSDCRNLLSLTMQAEWVQIHDDERGERYMQECAKEPRIERHKQGWEYIVVSKSGVPVKKGPSFSAENTGHILERQSVVCIERVTSTDQNGLTWLRLKDGGWVHEADEQSGEILLTTHSLRHRAKPVNSRPRKARQHPSHDDKNQQIAYNTLIARLFHTDGHGAAATPSIFQR